MGAILREQDAKDWVYKGEGAANLVLSYQGSSHSLIGKVLRLQKIPKAEQQHSHGHHILSKNEQLMWGEFKELVESTSKEVAGQVYATRVLSPLLDSKHVDCGICVTVTKKFLESVNKNVHSLRPSWRIDAAEIDINTDSALLISDHSVFASSKGTLKEDMCFTVEIKPKCGFLPSSEFIAERNDIKKSITRFRLHQLLKFHEGEISEVSAYDPLDLFSGSKDRISQGINALFTTPGNNFRIFLNGSLIFGGLGGGIDMTTISSHTAGEKVKFLLEVTGLKLVHFIELIAEALLKSAVLDKLLATQKLDTLDIEGAIHLYYNIVSEPCIVCKETRDTELLHRYSILHSFSIEESLKFVREFLVATTAKDCSLMISFRPTEVGATTTEYNSLFLKSCNRSFDYKANFIDLDLKHLTKMVYYYKLDKKIVDYYRENCMIEKDTGASMASCADDAQIQCHR